MKRKGCLIPVLVIFFILIAISAIIAIVTKNDIEHPLSTSQKYIAGITDEQGKQIDSILNNCGIKNITSIEHDELLDNAHEKKKQDTV